MNVSPETLSDIQTRIARYGCQALFTKEKEKLHVLVKWPPRIGEQNEHEELAYIDMEGLSDTANLPAVVMTAFLKSHQRWLNDEMKQENRDVR